MLLKEPHPFQLKYTRSYNISILEGNCTLIVMVVLTNYYYYNKEAHLWSIFGMTVCDTLLYSLTIVLPVSYILDNVLLQCLLLYLKINIT